jgi:hypothetical protein
MDVIRFEGPNPNPTKRSRWSTGSRVNSPAQAAAGDGGFNENDTKCLSCTLSTNNFSDEVLMCNGCEGEVHLACSGLKQVPRGDDWFCAACKCQSAALPAVLPATVVPPAALTTTSLSLDSVGAFFQSQSLIEFSNANFVDLKCDRLRVTS